jgi:uncharacterized protein (DUF1501 family)
MSNNPSQTPAAHPTIPSDRDILVCIFQRGAADGLNALVPYDDTNYPIHRPGIQVPKPDSLNPAAAIDIDGFFGLHPALAPLRPIYMANDLAFVHATGMPHKSRSHFSAQGLIERGVVDKAGPDTGWLGRHLSLSPPAVADSAFRIVALSGNVPVALTGASEPLAISNLGEFGFDQGIIDSGYPLVLADLFRNPLPFSGPAGAALSALDELRVADLPSFDPGPGAYPPTLTGNKLKQVGQLIKSELPVEVVCLDSDGWDHHERLPVFIDQSLTELADALSAFYNDMGPQMQRITVLVYTEFGRRIAENGSEGVDHGTGSLAYLIGGGVNGGQIVADWPGLEIVDPILDEDLKITTDLRSVLLEMLTKRLGGTNAGVVFPGFTDPATINIFL